MNNVERNVVIGLVLVIVAAVAVVVATSPELIVFQPFSVPEFLADFAPLLLVALFIERALEVFLTIWRAQESDVLENRMHKAAKRAAIDAAAMTAAEDADLALKRYKGGTRRMAFLGGITLGVVVAAVGVRGLEMFLATDLATVPVLQRQVFGAADVLLTGALVGGGADGIHKVVRVFTDFLERRPQPAPVSS